MNPHHSPKTRIICPSCGAICTVLLIRTPHKWLCERCETMYMLSMPEGVPAQLQRLEFRSLL